MTGRTAAAQLPALNDTGTRIAMTRNAELYASQNAQRRTSGIMVGEAPDYSGSNGSARG